MERIILLLLTYRTFVLFISLQIASLFLLAQSNRYQRAVLVSSSSTVMGSILYATGQIHDFVTLGSRNRKLAEENAQLRAQLNRTGKMPNFVAELDSVQYRFIPARVIKNSLTHRENYITLDKGCTDSIAPDLGVINSDGVVGIIQGCSPSYAIAKSLLNESLVISSVLQKNGQLCLTRWEQGDYTRAQLLHLGRHVNVLQGDTVVTSGGNSVFPPGVMIGVVETVQKSDAEPFQQISLKLAVDFGKLGYVYVTEHTDRAELDTLQKLMNER